MKRLLAGLLLAASLQGFGAQPPAGGHHHAAGPRYGRYLGLAVFDSLGVKIPCSLDLTVMLTNPGQQYEHLTAFFKLLPGGFESGEYFAQYYDKVLYSWEKNTIQLTDSSADLAAGLKVNGDKLEGEIRSRSGRTMGHLVLSLLISDDEEPDPAEPVEQPTLAGEFGAPSAVPLLAGLAGDWKGTCGEDSALLQIHTAKGSGISFDTQVGGSLGYAGSCGLDGKPSFCWSSGFTSGVYQPLAESGTNLRLNGPRRGLDCRVSGGQTASCRNATETCRFSLPSPQTPKGLFYFRTAHARPTTEDKKPLPATLTPADLKGEFWGLLHHEILNRYQIVRFSIDSFYDTDTPHRGLEFHELSAEATLFLGGRADGDRVVEKFDVTRVPDSFADFTFSGSQDAMFRVLDWRKGSLRGVWYSKSFGRVGTLELLRGSPPEFKGVRFIPALGGTYQTATGLQVQIRTATQLAQAAANLLDIQGTSFWLGGPTGPEIRRGSYDFYTGKVGLESALGALVTGRVGDAALDLLWPVEPTSEGGGTLPMAMPLVFPVLGGARE